MAYSDYGGYAYRNGVRVKDRSDCTITPKGDTFGTPESWPGFAMMAAGLSHEESTKRSRWPHGHAVLGDGPIYVVLYKQSYLRLHRGPEELEAIDFLHEMPPEAISTNEWEGKTYKSLNTEYFCEQQTPCVFMVDGWRVEVHFLETDNYYQYARVTQPDGAVWTGFSGYGVGAGLENSPDHGYSTDACVDMLVELFKP